MDGGGREGGRKQCPAHPPGRQSGNQAGSKWKIVGGRGGQTKRNETVSGEWAHRHTHPHLDAPTHAYVCTQGRRKERREGWGE
mmetsp:Transcript_21871/g.53612  ORF Transcript_21871/g.53612 Transcript_21871/m.53612 type:complete len:83 (-) Transcript_21871:263-511(-)